MKAAVLKQAGQPLEICDVDIDAPGPARSTDPYPARLVSAGPICISSTGHTLHNCPPFPAMKRRAWSRQWVETVSHVAPGDHVVTFLVPFCGTCELCANGQQTLCQSPSLQRGEDAAPKLSMDGAPVHQFLNLSAFAQQMLVHENACVKIDAAMPFDRAALLGCAVITGAGAVFNDSKLKPGESVAVIGAGGIGLSAVNAAKIAGAGIIIAIDPVASKRDLALKMGATHVYDANDGNVAKQIIAATNGGVHYSIEAVGRPETAELAWTIARRGGQATIVGMIAPGKMVTLHGPTLLSGKTLKGSLMGSTHFKTDMPRLAKFYLDGALDLDTIIAERITLDEINEGFDKLRGGGDARSVIIFD